MKRGMKIGAFLCAMALLALTACGDADNGDTNSGGDAPSVAKVQAGINDPSDSTIAVLQFLPGSASVATGSSVEWSFPGPEPHSVTFMANGAAPPAPGTPEASKLQAPVPPAGAYDGTATISSGLLPQGPVAAKPFRVTFSKAGEYKYVCIIHPLMTGLVKVGSGEAQSAIDARAKTEREAYLAEGRDMKKKYAATAARTVKSGSATTHYVEMGTTSKNVDILAFQPIAAKVAKGDTIVFVNNSGAPHTATFGPAASIPKNPEDPKVLAPTPGKSPQDLTTGAYLNTGWLPPNSPPGAGPPEAARSFAYRAKTAGTFPFVCVLHVPSGMTGTITVA